MGPQMLEFAGSVCDGTILTFTGPRTIAEILRLRECGANEVAIVPMPVGAPGDMERTIATLGQVAAAA